MCKLYYVRICSRFPQLSKIIKFVMVLLHGLSADEIRFSANKNRLVENVCNKIIQFQIMVVDYMKSNDYNSHDVLIDQKLIRSVKRSHCCFGM